jgi:hypothetical protein
MKKIIFAVFSMISIFTFSQIERIESMKLDSLIWKKINEYRISKAAPVFEIFEDSLMHQFCTRVAYRNIDADIPVHSDSVGYWSNAECLFYFKSTGFGAKELINESTDEKFEFLAEKAVQSWIHSPTHEMAISRPEYNIATVVSIVIIDRNKESIRFESTYHALDKNHNTFNGYIYSKARKNKIKID